MMGSRLRRCAGGAWIFLLVVAFTGSPLYPDDMNGFHHPLLGDIVITELMVNPDMVSDANGEYVELYNRTSSAIDLDGWLLRDSGSDSHVIDNGGPLVIGVGEFLVLARNANIAENGGFAADYEYSGLFLSNTQDGLILAEPLGAVIDSVVYSEDLRFPLEAGASMELRNEFWENTMGVSWGEASVPFGLGDKGSPGSENSVHEEFKWVAMDAGVESSPVSPGDSVVVRVCMFNPSWLDWSVEAASFLILPDGLPFPGNPFEGPYDFAMSSGKVLEARRAYRVPEGAPFGTYGMIYGVRERDGEMLDCERIEFEVTSLLRR